MVGRGFRVSGGRGVEREKEREREKGRERERERERVFILGPMLCEAWTWFFRSYPEAHGMWGRGRITIASYF
jgi:hypothetical protein